MLGRSRGPMFVLAAGAVTACSILTNFGPLERDAGTTDASVGDGSLPDTSTADGALDGADAPSKKFSDDFNRADANSLGNGWIDKVSAFRIVSGQAVPFAATLDYRDAIAYRPPNEDLTDVTASMTVHYGTTTSAWPQLHIRVQHATVAKPDTLDDYLLFPQGGATTVMVIARNRGAVLFNVLTTFGLASGFSAGQRYRFTFSAIGSAPVFLSAEVEMLQANKWVSIGKGVVQDGDVAKQIAGGGSVGFSAGDDSLGEYAYDDFSSSGN